MLLHSALDSADGQLARLKQMSTPLGRIVDGLCDNLAFGAIYLAICAGYWSRSSGFRLHIAALAALAAMSHSVQSSLVEYVRMLYLHCVHTRPDIVDAQPERLRQTAAPGVVATMLRAVHEVYYHQQRFVLRSTAALRTQDRALAHGSAPVAPGAGLALRGEPPPLLRTGRCSPRTRTARDRPDRLRAVWPGSFWAGLGMGWYFVYVLALNAAAVVLLPAQRRADRRLSNELDDRARRLPRRALRQVSHHEPEPR